MSPTQKLEFSLRAARDSSLGYALWYLGLAFVFWIVLYVVFRAALKHRRSGYWPLVGQMGREAWHSLRSIFVYGLITVPIVYAVLSGWSRMYPRVADYGWTWYAASIGLMIVMHDTYFYWTHRAMHHRWLYRLFHKTHHLSTDPTPWAAYAFSPWEALVQAGIAPVILFTLPVHPSAFGLFMIWQISFNVLGHCGYEIYPRWFLNTPLGYLMNTVTHHEMHHEKFRGNYGLYFNVWDRLMGTNRADYAQRFAQVTGAAAASANPPRPAVQSPLHRPIPSLTPHQ